MSLKKRCIELLDNKNFHRSKSNRELVKQIVAATSFLPESALMAERKYCIANDIEAPIECSLPTCNKPTKFSKGKYNTFCSQKCVAISKASESSKRMSDPKTRDKIRKTNMERFGGQSPFSSPEVRKKAKKTILNRFDVEYASQSPEIANKISKALSIDSFERLEKSAQTKLERYGDANYNNREKAKSTKLERYGDANYNNREKSEQTCKSRYGARNPNINPTTEGVLNCPEALTNLHHGERLTCGEIGELVGTHCSTIARNLHRHGVDIKRFPSSSYERELSNFLLSHNINHITSDRTTISPLELDIVIPEASLAIEINGEYFHSEKFIDKNYHFRKYDECRKVGFTLLQYWGTDWVNKKDIIKKSILNKTGVDSRRVYARKCSVVTPDTNTQRAFYNSNHIQGYKSASKVLGLEYDGKIVAMMSFVQLPTHMELVRFASSIPVIGGFTKLLSKVSGKIVSFSDNMHSNGALYRNNGFEVHSNVGVDYKYLYKNRLHHKFRFRKSRFNRDVNLTYNHNMTEHQLALDNGLVRVYDAGKIKYVRE